jgi:cytochrome c oxidase subunit III
MGQPARIPPGAEMAEKDREYYVPEPSHWPIVGSVGLFFIAFGAALWIRGGSPVWTALGAAILIYMIFGWLRTVVRENQRGLYSAQVDRSYRWGMTWFIFSEVMFFVSFFIALFYARWFAVPWLGGEGQRESTALLWPDFIAEWPTSGPANLGGDFMLMEPWGIPAINTLILLTSGVTITWAHWGLRRGIRRQLITGLIATIALGLVFLSLQAYEYVHAYTDLNLKLTSGIYGTTFYMLTGFHGLHVTIGAIMLIVILFRSIAGHFTPNDHFGFEAAAWYWHFVDVVWLFLFVTVYWLI